MLYVFYGGDMHSDFKPVDQFEQFQEFSSWKVIESFSPHNIHVDAKGEPVSGFYNGRTYLLLSKIEKTFSLFERIWRVISAILLVLISLCTAICISFIRELFSAEQGKIMLGFIYRDLDAARAINGVLISANTLLSIEENCLERQSCHSHYCLEEHPCTHLCVFVDKNGIEFRKILNAIEIRDILNWRSHMKFENEEHFSSHGKSQCLKTIRTIFQRDLQGFMI